MKRDELNKIMDRADEFLRPEGFWCIEAEWNQHDEVLRLFVDREGGVNMDACVQATRILRDEKLVDSLEAGSFNLEVSSPGLERPLRRPSDFQKVTGQEIRVHLTEKIGENRKVQGILIAVAEDGELSLEMSGDKLSIPLSSVLKASLIYKWGI